VSDLFGSLVSIVVLPYLGAGTARRELARPAPRPRGAPNAWQLSESGEAAIGDAYALAGGS
jgi:hypothetical protein